MGVELLYNSVKTEVRVPVRVGGGRRDVVGKATSGLGALGPDELGSREVADKMQ